MTSLRNEIPRLAYIEAQVLHRAAATGALSESVRAVENHYKLPNGSLGSGVFLESRVLTLLYCLVVVPKEIWASEAKHPVYKAIASTWTVPDKAVTLPREGDQGPPIYDFIHHLRNAVAHARFSFDGRSFHFWDQRQNEREPSFRASLTIENLQRLLETVGALLANLGSVSAAQQRVAADGALRVRIHLPSCPSHVA